MRERVGFFAPFAAVAAMLGLCCGLPVLLSLGVLSAAAGVSVRSWVLVGLGLVVAVVGWARWARRRAGAEPGAATGTGHHDSSRGVETRR